VKKETLKKIWRSFEWGRSC